MPMKSKNQRAYLHANKPKIAKKFESETKKGVKLPKKVKAKSCAKGKKTGRRR